MGVFKNIKEIAGSLQIISNHLNKIYNKQDEYVKIVKTEVDKGSEITTINTLSNNLAITSKLDSISSSLNSRPTFSSVEEMIKIEYQYNKDLERVKEENELLFTLVNNYCKVEDKYDAIKIFDELNKKYDITEKKASIKKILNENK